MKVEQKVVVETEVVQIRKECIVQTCVPLPESSMVVEGRVDSRYVRLMPLLTPEKRRPLPFSLQTLNLFFNRQIRVDSILLTQQLQPPSSVKRTFCLLLQTKQILLSRYRQVHGSSSPFPKYQLTKTPQYRPNSQTTQFLLPLRLSLYGNLTLSQVLHRQCR